MRPSATASLAVSQTLESAPKSVSSLIAKLRHRGLRSNLLPLVFASGPGFERRQALGTAVFFGMIGVTAFGLVFTPVFYVATRALGERLKRRRGERPDELQPSLLPAE